VGPTQPPVQWVPDLSQGVKSGRGVTLIPHPILVPWSRKSRAIPLLPLWAVRPVQSFSACTRVTFTFTLHYEGSSHFSTVNLVVSVSLSVCLSVCSHGTTRFDRTDFHEI